MHTIECLCNQPFLSLDEAISLQLQAIDDKNAGNYRGENFDGRYKEAYDLAWNNYIKKE